MNPAISVVIVSYRSRSVLTTCLDSLRACVDATRLEVIVVDNASGDGTVEQIRRDHPEATVIENSDNRGFTRGVNQGVEAARGEYLFILNPDCVVAADALACLIRRVETEPRTAAAAPMLLDGGRRAARSCGRFPNLWTLVCDAFGLARVFPDSALFGPYKYGGEDPGSLRQVDWASGAALLVPRHVWAEVGGFDEGMFMYMEEVDWCRRAAKVGLHVRFVPEAQVLHHGQRSSRLVPRETLLHNLRSRVYYFRKHHGPFATWAAKGILLVSLTLKWCATVAVRRSWSRVYVQGLEVVWAA